MHNETRSELIAAQLVRLQELDAIPEQVRDRIAKALLDIEADAILLRSHSRSASDRERADKIAKKARWARNGLML